jgi:hypothetical protein
MQMEMGMLMAGGMLRMLNEDRPASEAFAWAHDGGREGAIRLAIALLLIAAIVLVLDTHGIRWLWGALSGLHGSVPP